MLSKRNFNKRQMNEKKERFSIRKFSVGAASVVIGLTFAALGSQTANADTVLPAKEVETKAPGVVDNPVKVEQPETLSQATYEKAPDKQKENEQPQPPKVTVEKHDIDPAAEAEKKVQDSVAEEVDVYLPGHNQDDGENEYRAVIKRQPIDGTKDSQGKVNWNKANFDAASIADVLKNGKFINTATGYHEALPENLKDYIPVITSVKTGYSDEYAKEASQLANELRAKTDGQASTTLPGYSVTAPINVIYNIHFEEWVKTGETKTFTRTIRTWYQYTVSKGNVYTFADRQDANAEEFPTIKEKTYKVSLDEYRNAKGETEWRINPEASSSMSELLSEYHIPYIDGYHIGIYPSYGQNIVPNSKLAGAVLANTGSQVTKLLGDHKYVPDKGNEIAYKDDGNGTGYNILQLVHPAQKDGIYHQTPNFFGQGDTDQMLDVYYIANLHSVTTKIIDQDTNKVLSQYVTPTSIPTDWTWAQGNTVKIPAGYHLGTKKGNPIPYYDIASGKYVKDGKVVRSVQLRMGSESITYVYYVQKNQQPTQPSQPTTPVSPSNPAIPVVPDQPTAPTNPEPVKPETPAVPDQPTQAKDDNYVEPVKPQAKPEAKHNSAKAKVVKTAKENNNAPVKAAVSASTKKVMKNEAASSKKTLPQTGEQKSAIGLFGLVIAAIAGIFGLGATKKKN